MNGNKVKKKLVAPNINLTLDQSEESVLSDLEDSKDIDLDDIDTPSENSNEFEWEGKVVERTRLGGGCKALESKAGVGIKGYLPRCFLFKPLHLFLCCFVSVVGCCSARLQFYFFQTGQEYLQDSWHSLPAEKAWLFHLQVFSGGIVFFQISSVAAGMDRYQVSMMILF